MFATLSQRLQADGMATLTLPVQTARGVRWHELSARSCRDAATGADALLVSEADVTLLKESEAQASYLASHDSLTGLPNRSNVRQHFALAVRDLQSSGGQAALVVIDLDHFKNVNDTLGHAVGDELLIEVSKRLRAAVRRGDLEVVLPEWRLPQGIAHAVFASRRGLLPAVRVLIDFLAEKLPPRRTAMSTVW